MKSITRWLLSASLVLSLSLFAIGCGEPKPPAEVDNATPDAPEVSIPDGDDSSAPADPEAGEPKGDDSAPAPE